METTSNMSFLAFFFLLLIWMVLFMTWAFTIWDIFRRHDIHGGAKAGWFVLIMVLPFVGTLIYLGFRPKHADPVYSALPEGASPVNKTEQLAMLVRFKEAGHLTDAEFEAQKAKLM
jgi:hypothetical protein